MHQLARSPPLQVQDQVHYPCGPASQEQSNAQKRLGSSTRKYSIFWHLSIEQQWQEDVWREDHKQSINELSLCIHLVATLA